MDTMSEMMNRLELQPQTIGNEMVLASAVRVCEACMNDAVCHDRLKRAAADPLLMEVILRKCDGAQPRVMVRS
jgi:hypothetical protein